MIQLQLVEYHCIHLNQCLLPCTITNDLSAGHGTHPYLLCLAARSMSVSAVGHKVLTVIPQQTVGDGSDLLLGSLGHIFIGKRLRLHHLIHAVDQDAGAVSKVLQRVNAHRGALVDAAEDQPLVCYDRADELRVVREHGEDVRDQMSHFVVTQVNAEVGENGPRDLEQVSSPGGRRWSAVRRGLLLLTVQPAGLKEFEVGEEGELLHQECQQLQHRASCAGKCLQVLQ